MDNCHSNRGITKYRFSNKRNNRETNTTLKRPVNKLFPIENTYEDTNQTDKAKGTKVKAQEAAIIGELRENMNVNCVGIGRRGRTL